MARLILLVICSLLLWRCQPDASHQDSRPNILFIFADDQLQETIQALGNQEVRTPNLDRLVKRGVSFSNAYNMGAWNGAVCTASRHMLVSGRSVWRANEFRHQWGRGEALDQSWPRLMAQAGYETYMTGKWHVDAKAEDIFDHVTHVRPGMPPDNWDHHRMMDTLGQILERGGGFSELAGAMPIGYNRPLGPGDNSWSPTDSSHGGFWSGGQHWSEVLRDDAVGFLEDAGKRETPFFMYLAFNAAHDPRQAPQSYQDMYDEDQLTLPASWMPLYPFQDQMGGGPTLRDEALAPFPRTEYALRVHTKEYYALITHMDEQIGAILDALEATGKADNTVIFFTADHGLAMGRHGLLGKQSMFEHSVKVPFIVSGPGFPAGTKVDHPIYLQDLMATSLDLAGVEKPAYVEFESVLPLINGGETPSNTTEPVYGAYINFQRMIRKGADKLIVYPQADKVLLYDLANDPHEIQDLAEDPVHQTRAATLFKELMELQVQMEDTLDLSPLFAARFGSN